ncbi:LuxR C-terminal-related transcriptional regulator [Bacillus subtilis]
MTLTRHQIQVIAGLALGHRTHHIAVQLGLSDAALKSRIAYTAHRLNVHGLIHPQLVHHAYAHGYLTTPAPPDTPLTSLPMRQAQSLAALTRGLSVERTAAELGIAYDTANTQRRFLYRRLEAHTGAQAVALGWLHGLLGGETT